MVPTFSLHMYLLEVISNLKFALLLSNVRLHFGISVVDNGQEHVEQHEEDEEHVGDEEDRSKHTVRVFDLVEIEVTEDDTE